MRNCVSINLRKNQILIKISDNAEQKEIVDNLKRKLPELKKMYKNEKNTYYGYRKGLEKQRNR